MLIEVNPGHKRPDTLPLEIGEQGLMLKVEEDVGLIPDTILLRTNLNVLDS